MQSKTEKGMYGQKEAERFLIEKGCEILERNYRIRTAEIDLIALDGTYTVFVEVKYRKDLSYGYPREAVSAQKQKRIKQAALHYVSFKTDGERDFRFDVVELFESGGRLEINHIENAFN